MAAASANFAVSVWSEGGCQLRYEACGAVCAESSGAGVCAGNTGAGCGNSGKKRGIVDIRQHDWRVELEFAGCGT